MQLTFTRNPQAKPFLKATLHFQMNYGSIKYYLLYRMFTLKRKHMNQPYLFTSLRRECIRGGNLNKPITEQS